MPVAFDGLIFAIVFWVICSVITFRWLRRRLKGMALIGSMVGAFIGVGVVSFGVFVLYEWLAGRA